MMKAMIFGMMAVLALAVSANAAVIATDNFESDTVGSTPSGTGWIVSTTGAGANALVELDSDPAHHKVLEVTSDGTDDSAVLWNYEPTYSSAGGAIQFEMKLNSVTPSGIVRVGDAPNYGNPFAPISMIGASGRSANYFGASNPGVTDNQGDTLVGGAYAAFPGSTDGGWHTVTIVVGPSSSTGGTGGGGGGTEQVYFDYALVASGLYSSAPGYAVEFGINTQTLTAHDIVVDNIKVGDTFDDVAPEPASLSLLGIGGLLVLRRRRQA